MADRERETHGVVGLALLGRDRGLGLVHTLNGICFALLAQELLIHLQVARERVPALDMSRSSK